MITILDVETTTSNKGHVFDPRNFLVSYAYKCDSGAVTFKYYTDPDFISCLRSIIERSTCIIGFNIKFDLHWCNKHGIKVPEGCKVFDCSLAEFILTGQQAVMVSLDECLESYGLPQKYDRVKEYWDQGINTQDIPYEILEEYNKWDVEVTELLWDTQLQLLGNKQYNLVIQEGYDLLTILDAESNGLRFDTEAAVAEVCRRQDLCKEINRELNAYLPEIPEQCEFNWDSGDQLSALIYGGTIEYEYAVSEDAIFKSGARKGEEYIRRRWYSIPITFQGYFTPIEGSEVKKTKDDPDAETRFYQIDDPTFRKLKTRDKKARRLLELLAARAKETKVIEMMQSILNLIETYQWGDYLHPQYNQNVTRTGRLSSSKPNGQNQPPEIDALIVSRYD